MMYLGRRGKNQADDMNTLHGSTDSPRRRNPGLPLSYLQRHLHGQITISSEHESHHLGNVENMTCIMASMGSPRAGHD